MKKSMIDVINRNSRQFRERLEKQSQLASEKDQVLKSKYEAKLERLYDVLRQELHERPFEFNTIIYYSGYDPPSPDYIRRKVVLKVKFRKSSFFTSSIDIVLSGWIWSYGRIIISKDFDTDNFRLSVVDLSDRNGRNFVTKICDSEISIKREIIDVLSNLDQF